MEWPGRVEEEKESARNVDSIEAFDSYRGGGCGTGEGGNVMGGVVVS